MAWLAFFTLFALYSFSIAVIFYDLSTGERADVPIGPFRRISQMDQIGGNRPEPWEVVRCPMNQQLQKTDWKSEGF